MVSFASIACMAVSALVAFALPIVGFVVVRKRFGARFVPLATGALCFFVFAMMLEPVAHAVFLPMIGNNAALYVIYGCLAAGVFEELGRACGFFLLARGDHKRTSTDPADHGGLGRGLAYGIGHGGIEAILLCAFVMLSNISLALIINGSGVDGVLAQLPEASRAVGEVQIQGLIDAPAATFLISGAERIIAFSLQVTLSVLVWMAVTGAIGRGWIAASILLHAAANGGAGLYQVGLLPLALAELWALAATIVAIFVVVKLWKRVQAQSPSTPKLDEAAA